MSEILKRCGQCGEAKPLREFHRQNRNPDGYRTVCKKCRAQNEGFSYRPTGRPGYRYCRCCQKELPATEEFFYRDITQKAGYSSFCRDCQAQKWQEWHSKNPQKVDKAKKEWSERNGERTRQSGRERYHKNKEKYRQYYFDNYRRRLEWGREWYWKNLDKARESAKNRAKRWRKTKPFSARAVIQRRAARKRQLPDTLTADQWRRALDYFGGCCAVCGRPVNGLFHTAAIDHWVALSDPACPGTVAENIVPLCHGQDGCNNSKGPKPALAWLVEKFGHKKAAVILDKISTYFAWVRTQDA